jgi:hypothetical protein
MILCIVAAGFSPHIGTLQSSIFMRHRVCASRMRDCVEAFRSRIFRTACFVVRIREDQAGR